MNVKYDINESNGVKTIKILCSIPQKSFKVGV